MHFTLANEVSDLAGEAGVAWNRMAVACIEIGIPVMRRLRIQAPTVAKEVLRVRRGPLSKRNQRTVDQVTEKEIGKQKLDTIIGFAAPTILKRRLEREKRRSGVSMSAQVRRRLE
jgi:hypothetical protein